MCTAVALSSSRLEASLELEAKQEGRAEGLAKGKAEVTAEAKAEAARKLKTLGVAIDIIVQATGLSREEVEAL